MSFKQYPLYISYSMQGYFRPNLFYPFTLANMQFHRRLRDNTSMRKLSPFSLKLNCSQRGRNKTRANISLFTISWCLWQSISATPSEFKIRRWGCVIIQSQEYKKYKKSKCQLNKACIRILSVLWFCKKNPIF